MDGKSINCIGIGNRLVQRWGARAAIVAIISIIVLSTVFAVDSIAPFGAATSSLAVRDAQVQYLDLFYYFKNVCAGQDSFTWTLSKGLGGTAIAVFSYYLSSPFNVLFLLFPYEAVPAVFDVVVMLKLALAAATMSIFLSFRFAGLRTIANACLSISYALMQYSIAQSFNIMWLDGVYMLPLVLLGVYRTVLEHRPAMLAASVGLSILFNWYTGGINCAFAIVWFLFEVALGPSTLQRGSGGVPLLRLITRFSGAMALGVGMSLALFLPTVLELSGGRAAGGWLGLHPATLYGNPLNLVKQLVIGSASTQSNISLFCGSLATVAALSCLVCRRVPRRARLAILGLLAFSAVMLYWQPLVAAFSLFKSTTSYYSRYSYLSIFSILFAAGAYLEATGSAGSEAGRREAPAAAGALCLAFLALVAIGEFEANWRVAATCACTLSQGVALGASSLSRRRAARVATALGCGALAVELGANAVLLQRTYSSENVASRAAYGSAQMEQVGSLSADDSGPYRINQTSTWNMLQGGLTANYNEGLAYVYPSVQTYTSDPDDAQREFLDSLGYTICGENMNIVNVPILGADSLLGVRYVLSSYGIPALELVDGTEGPDSKLVWENPYALPLAFGWSGDEDEDALSALSGGGSGAEGNPFEYQNELWSQLAGHEVGLCSPIPFTISETAPGSGTLHVKSDDVPEGSVVYALVRLSGPWADSNSVVIGDTELAYHQWLAPSVVWVPVADDGTATFDIELAAGNSVDEVLLYALDLSALEEASSEVAGRGADIAYSPGGAFDMTVRADAGDELLLTVPLRDGWEVTVNGERVEPRAAFGCLASIPLDEGESAVAVRYAVPGLLPGAVASAASVAATLLLAWRGKRGESAARERSAA